MAGTLALYSVHKVLHAHVVAEGDEITALLEEHERCEARYLALEEVKDFFEGEVTGQQVLLHIRKQNDSERSRCHFAAK